MNDNDLYRTPTREEVTAMITEANRLRSDTVAGMYRGIGRAIVSAARTVRETGASLFEAIGEAREARELYHRLSAMSDRELAAQGLSRSDIPGAVAAIFNTVKVETGKTETTPAKPAARRVRAARPAEDIRQAA